MRLQAAFAVALLFGSPSWSATIEDRAVDNIAVKCAFATDLAAQAYQNRDNPSWDSKAALTEAMKVLNSHELGSSDTTRLALMASRETFMTAIHRTGVKVDMGAAQMLAAAVCGVELYRLMSGDRTGIDKLNKRLGGAGR
jgi:hypothetical protein